MKFFKLFLILVPVIFMSLFFIDKFRVQKISYIPLSSITQKNTSQSLSTTLIQNKIYPRHKNANVKLSYNNISCPLFITMADSFYLPAVENFHFELKQYNLHKNFLVMCLDEACVQTCQSKNILAWWGFVNTSVARIKVRS